jgi:imidazolonepropionase-like amidohydrolase
VGRRSGAGARLGSAGRTVGCVTGWRVRASLLPDGDLVEAGVTERGQWTLRPGAGAEELPGRFILPGLVDAHCHLSVRQAGSGGPVALEPEAVRANLMDAHAAGITAIRDTGSPGSLTLRLLATGDGVGLQACGRFLAPEGRYYPGLHVPVPAEQLVPAALAEIRDGATWIKVIADFPFLGPGKESPAPLPTYPLDDIRRLVEAVHGAGARVAAHSTTGYVTDLIAAGIDSVEHGTALDEAGIEALAARGGAWTPTLCATTGPRASDTPARQQAGLELRERLRYLLPKAAECGLTIMTGTDVVGSIPARSRCWPNLACRPARRSRRPAHPRGSSWVSPASAKANPPTWSATPATRGTIRRCSASRPPYSSPVPASSNRDPRRP